MQKLWFEALPEEWRRGCKPKVFEAAFGAHDTPGRVVHGWPRVLADLEVLRGFPCEAPRTAMLSLLYRFAIFVPARSDNARWSAFFAMEVLKAHSSLDDAERRAVERTILASADPQARGAALPESEAAALDIHMRVLGEPQAEYERHAEGVKRELFPSVMGERRYRIVRARELRRMLAAPSLYLTEEGRQRWEGRARANVVRELDAHLDRIGFLARWIFLRA